MTTTSSIPAFKAALKARLLADAGLAGVQIVRVDPFPTRPANEHVVISQARARDVFRNSQFGGGQKSATIGRLAREERYVVDVVCRVLSSTQVTAEAIEERAYELAAAVQSSVDAWALERPQFDGLVRHAHVDSTEDWFSNDDKKREARVTIGIAVQTRINL